MTRTVLLLSLLLCTVSGAQQAPRRVAVLPFQASSGDVPGRAGPRVTQRLVTEVRGVEGLELAEAPATEPPPDALAQAREAVKDARARWQKRDLAGADASIGQALDAYATVAAALPSGNELADAYALRSAVRYSQGRDEEAARALGFALTLSPRRALPLASSSPLFARTVERAQAALREQPRGTVRFVSVPPGIPVTLDGHAVENTPVRVAEVPPGGHLWRAVLPSGETTGGVVEVLSGKEVEVKVRPPGDGAEATVSSALAGNRLDAAAVEAAKALGQTLRAELVLFGTVSQAGSGLALDIFVLAPEAKAPRRVPRISLDADLLDAGPPLRELASTLAARGSQAGEAVSLPATPSAGAGPAPRLAQVKYPVEEKPVSAPKPVAPTPDRAPLAPRKPLVRP
ncbi:PEGA domain-containing protein [Hyalangium gracile]|uniref:PEGA domain-containing protein n=1 Tax=Hyalangium gracile TaxID=394092 RepID=UPI001CD035F3|nr:PEGA domain-containing protein [Hyalangium gracile]